MKKGFLIVMGAVLVAGGAAGLVSTQLLGTGGESGNQGEVLDQQAQGTPPAAPETAPPQVQMNWPKISAQPEAVSGDETRREEEELRGRTAGSNEKRGTAEPPAVLKGERRYPKQARIAKEGPAAKKQKAAARGKTGKYASARQKQKTGKAQAHGVPSRYAARRQAKQNPAPSTRGGYVANARPARARPVVIRFRFDPARGSEIQVARVHLGDRVEARIRKHGGDGRQLYLAFNSRERPERSDPPYYRGAIYQSYQIRTLIEDGRRLTIAANREFDPGLVEALGSERGAVLKLGVNRGYPDGPYRRYFAPERVYYEIELRIYAENRMNILPRSLI